MMSDRTPALSDLKNLLRSWIPPFGILFGLLAFSFSWILMLGASVASPVWRGIPFRFILAWIHTLAIGFFTVTALSVLFHVMPAFTGTPWKKEMLARKSLPFLALGVSGMVGFFLRGNTWTWEWGFFVAAGAILFWAGLFFASLLKIPGRSQDRSPLSIFLLPVGFLVLAAIIGVSMGGFLMFPSSSGWIYSRGIPIHMAAGLLGWLTILLWIVSSRTRVPILGVRPTSSGWLSVSVGLLASGTLLFGIGRLLHEKGLSDAGGIFAGAGALVYLTDSVRILRKAAPPHPVFMAWWATGIMGLFGSFLAGEAVVFTDKSEAPLFFVYLLLAGWIQPFLLGHLHQIGVRLLATLVRGAEDQTPPAKLLSNVHAWGFWGLFAVAFLSGFVGVATGERWPFLIGGVLGIFSACLLADHLFRMVKRCRELPANNPQPISMIRFPP